MTDPGLNNRLRQRSRRAGIMIGISMALTIAVCVGGFSVIYAALDGFTGDFVSRDAPTVEPTSRPVQGQNSGGQDVASNQQSEDQSTSAQPTDPPPTAEPSPTSEAFVPDYQVTASGTVNLRSGPGTNSDIVTSLTSETPLQFLDDRQQTEDADADGFDGEWMKFRTEDGDEGWIREIDVGDYEP